MRKSKTTITLLLSILLLTSCTKTFQCREKYNGTTCTWIHFSKDFKSKTEATNWASQNTDSTKTTICE